MYTLYLLKKKRSESKEGKKAKLAPIPHRIPNVKYMVDILVANDVSSNPVVARTLPVHVMARQPKCSHSTVVIGPVKNRSP